MKILHAIIAVSTVFVTLILSSRQTAWPQTPQKKITSQPKQQIPKEQSDSFRPATVQDQLEDLERKITALKAEMLTLIKQQEEEQGKTSFRLDVLDIKDRSWTEIDPLSRDGFYDLRTNLGNFFLSLRDARKYLDGLLLTFKIGNPYQAAFTDVRVKVRWGAREPKSYDDVSTWRATLKAKTIDLSKQMEPGAWSVVEVVLPSTLPEELGYLDVTLYPRGVALKKE